MRKEAKIGKSLSMAETKECSIGVCHSGMAWLQTPRGDHHRERPHAIRSVVTRGEIAPSPVTED